MSDLARANKTSVRQYRWILAAVFACCLVLFTLGNDAQLWDRDEPRYADATRAMLVTGDFILPTYNGEWRLEKPIAFYWLQAASMAVFGVNEFAARLPSAVLLALATLLLMHTMVRYTGRLRPGLLTAAAFAGCFMTHKQAHAGTIDASLVLVIAAAMLLWFEAVKQGERAQTPRERRANHWRWVGFYVLGAIGILLKMPIIVAVWLVTVVAYSVWNWPEMSRHVRLRPLSAWGPHLVGIAAGLAILLPWMIAISVQTDGLFLRQFIGYDVIQRASEPILSFAMPFYLYVPVLLLFFFPWMQLLLLHMRALPLAMPRSTFRFLVCWSVAPIVMFTFAATKLPHYIFPSFPALAMLAGFALDTAIRLEHGRRPGVGALRVADRLAPRRWMRWGVAGFFVLFAAVAFAVPVVFHRFGLHAPLIPLTLASLALALGSLVLSWQIVRRRAKATTVTACVMMLFFCLGVRLALPVFDEYKVAEDIGATLQEHVTSLPEDPLSPDRPVLHGFSYTQPSVSYYSRFVIEREDGEDRARLAECAAEYRNRNETMWFLVDFTAGPDGLSRHQRDAQVAEWAPEAQAIYGQSRLLEQFGPVLHYNTSRHHWRILELRQWRPSEHDLAKQGEADRRSE